MHGVLRLKVSSLRGSLHTASSTELQKPPGIGPDIAQRIIDYWKTHRPFQNIEDTKNISGIGEARFEQIKDYIKVVD